MAKIKSKKRVIVLDNIMDKVSSTGISVEKAVEAIIGDIEQAA